MLKAVDSVLELAVENHTVGHDDDGIEYAVYGLSVNIDNSPFAPSNTNGIQEFQATSKITLEVPLSFGGDLLPPMKVDLLVKSRYMPKF